METSIQEQFKSFADRFMEFMPNLAAGIILVIIGWLLGWLMKRILIQLSAILRVERFSRQSRFESDFSKADVRYRLYALIGNIGFVLIFLIFLDNALLTWRFKILSDLLSEAILFLPKIIVALVITGIGWVLALLVRISVLKTLLREAVPRASLISNFIRSLLLIFFSAIALVELDVAREIIIIAFASIFLTLSVITIVLTILGGKEFLSKVGESLNNSGIHDDKSK
jgi:hypothetical protein